MDDDKVWLRALERHDSKRFMTLCARRFLSFLVLVFIVRFLGSAVRLDRWLHALLASRKAGAKAPDDNGDGNLFM